MLVMKMANFFITLSKVFVYIYSIYIMKTLFFVPFSELKCVHGHLQQAQPKCPALLAALKGFDLFQFNGKQ